MSKTMADIPEKPDEEPHEPTLQDLIDLDPDFHKGRGTFDFPNGDKYEGDFYAHRSGKVWREGEGIYTTKDGQVYSGFWEDDRLVEDKELEITFADGTKYCGTMENNKFSGAGTMIFENNMKISAEFAENKPVGHITLFDKQDRMWLGLADKDEALLLPEHVFFSAINKDSGKGYCRKPEVVRKLAKGASLESVKTGESSKSSSKTESEDSVAEKWRAYREWEEEIFMKKSRVDDYIDFGDSKWYKDYLEFKNTYEPVVTKAKKIGKIHLSESEQELYDTYQDFKAKYMKTIQKMRAKDSGKPSEDMFEELEEFKKKCPPVSVLYPSEKSLSDYLASIDIFHEYEGN